MRYYKLIVNGIIFSVGTGPGGTEVSENEYREILSVIKRCPCREGYYYRLKEDLTWEEIERTDEDFDLADKAEAYDILMGVDAS